jgi:predicted ATPase
MADEPDLHARVTRIGGRSRALGQFVSLDLASPFTVLVGRNGAGKSALLHLFEQFMRHAITARRLENPSLVDEFECTAEIGARKYCYEAHIVEEPSEENSEFHWVESCWGESADKKLLWSARGGIVTDLSTKILVPRSTGVLALNPDHLPPEIAPVAAAIGRLFRHVTLIPAGLPAAVARNPIMFEREPKTGAMQMRGTSGSPRVDRFASQLVRWADTNNESFDHVCTVLHRIGVCDRLYLFMFGEDWGHLVLDDDYVSLEHASDGTLRVIEIVVALEMAATGALVMIEEPETGIHPGLCDRIMAEIESAADGLQLIISTHSPRILDRVQYHQLRHVRRNGSTRIDALTPEQVKEVKSFLDHEGTLSDYVFSPDFASEDDIEAG